MKSSEIYGKTPNSWRPMKTEEVVAALLFGAAFWVMFLATWWGFGILLEGKL